MKVYLVDDAGRHAATVPYHDAPHVFVPGVVCPCRERERGADAEETAALQRLRARGTGRRIAGHDAYEADAVCADCGRSCGVLRAEFSTIFGVEEDERVLNGRCRVY